MFEGHPDADQPQQDPQAPGSEEYEHEHGNQWWQLAIVLAKGADCSTSFCLVCILCITHELIWQAQTSAVVYFHLQQLFCCMLEVDA